MSQVIGFLVLAAVAAFWTYRQVCLLRVERVRRERRLDRLRRFQVRIVLMRPATPAAPPRSTNGHQLRLVAGNYQLPTPNSKG